MTDYLRHEALDRTSLLVDRIGRHLLEHEFVKADKSLHAKVARAQAILCDVYQKIGEQHMPKEPA